MADNLAKSVKLKTKSKILALTGDLGSGKTTFVQGLAEGIGVKNQIISPTFILMRKYEIPPITNHRSPITAFYHLDLYRLEGNIKEEVRNLGIEEIWKDPENIVVIEWAEKIEKMLPDDCYKIKFEVLSENKRKITIANYE